MNTEEEAYRIKLMMGQTVSPPNATLIKKRRKARMKLDRKGNVVSADVRTLDDPNASSEESEPSPSRIDQVLDPNTPRLGSAREQEERSASVSTSSHRKSIETPR